MSLSSRLSSVSKCLRARMKNKEHKPAVETLFGQFMLVFVGTALSIILTIGSDDMMEKQEQRNNERLTALMVMSNIEGFAQSMEKRSDRLAQNDSLAVWLLSKPVEELELLPQGEVNNMFNQAINVQFMSQDKTAENIFSYNTETWKNIGSVQFIDCVGQCFSAMNTVVDYWNKWATEMDDTSNNIKYHPDDYEGNTLIAKYMNNDMMRSLMQSIHARRGWLNYIAATMRHYNQMNMKNVGITEEELMEFINDREKEDEIDNPAPSFMDYHLPAIQPDSLFTFRDLDLRIDSLKGK